MARVGVSVTKATAFRDSTQEFANIYHYHWTGLDPGEGLAESLLDRVVTLEKTFHADDVSFLIGRVWNAGGTQAENDMIIEKNLSGVGAASPILEMDKERAILVRWRAGTDSKGRPVYLRKWFHTNCFAGVNVANYINIVNNKTGFTTADRAAINAKFDALSPISFNNGSTIGELVAKNGRQITGERSVHKYLEHHQLGDMWRG